MKNLLRVLIILCAAVILFYSVNDLYKNLTIVTNYTYTSGKIIKNNDYLVRDVGITVYSTVEFRDKEGIVYTFEGHRDYYLSSFIQIDTLIGKEVGVYYKQTDPRNAFINDYSFIGIDSFLLAAALVTLFVNLKSLRNLKVF